MAVAGKGPERIPLPDGYRPEGIAAGKGRSVYVGSIPTGRVLKIDTKTGVSREASAVTPIALTGFPLTEANNLNGIEAARNGRVLLAIQSS